MQTGPDLHLERGAVRFFWGRKGYEQAAAVASCQTGATRSDVHSVFTRGPDGELKELNIEEPDLARYPVLFDNRISRFRIEQGMLVHVFYGMSGRREALVIKYKWDADKERFFAVSVIAAETYPTSYDCSKVKTETEEEICYVQPLADLDLELAPTYKVYLNGLAPESRKAAREEQRSWLTKRETDCTVYKWWVECLADLYKQRIAELKKRIDDHRQQTPRCTDQG